jgi:hypothetical protein
MRDIFGLQRSRVQASSLPEVSKNLIELCHDGVEATGLFSLVRIREFTSAVMAVRSCSSRAFRMVFVRDGLAISRSPAKPKAARSMEMSMSSERRSMRLGERCSTFEAKFGDSFQCEKVFQVPADPKVFFDGGCRRVAASGSFLKIGLALCRFAFCEVVHRFASGADLA